MHTGSFNNLMNQFSTEAEQEKLEELRRIQQRLRAKKIRRIIFALFLVALAVVGYIKREPLIAKANEVQQKLKIGPLHGNAEKNAKQQIEQIKAAGEARSKAVDAAMDGK